MREGISDLENTKTPEEIRDCVVAFYSITSPERLTKWQNEESDDFIGEILSWTFRFGLEKLVNNLRLKYLGKSLNLLCLMILIQKTWSNQSILIAMHLNGKIKVTLEKD